MTLQSGCPMGLPGGKAACLSGSSSFLWSSIPRAEFPLCKLEICAGETLRGDRAQG